MLALKNYDINRQPALRKSAGDYCNNPQELEKVELAKIKALAAYQQCGLLETERMCYKKFENPYSNRILDALVRLLDFDGTCAALSVVVGRDGIKRLYISYNSDISPEKQENIKKTLFIILGAVDAQNSESLIDYCLRPNYQETKSSKTTEISHPFYTRPQNYKEIFNVAQINRAISLIITQDDITDLRTKIGSFLDLGNNQPKNNKELDDSIKKITDSLKDLPESAVDEESQKKIEDILKIAQSRMLYFRKRLKQDCEKLVKFFDKSNLKNILTVLPEDSIVSIESDFNNIIIGKKGEKLDLSNIIFLRNTRKIHAELNLREYLKGQGLYQTYIGISKLSCWVCDHVLRADEKGQKCLHGGSHGLIYSLDALPDSLIDGSEIILLQEINKALWTLKDKELKDIGLKHDAALQYADLSDSEEELTLEGSSTFLDTDIGDMNKYWGKYTPSAIAEILELRIESFGLKREVLLLEGRFIDEKNHNILSLIRQIVVDDVRKTILVPLNLFNKHAVGLVFTKCAESGIKVTYIDPSNEQMPAELKDLMHSIFKELCSGSKITIQELPVESQKYANCGPEVIENFIYHLNGTRMSQEEAIKLHSALMEKKLRSAAEVDVFSTLMEECGRDEDFILGATGVFVDINML